MPTNKFIKKVILKIILLTIICVAIISFLNAGTAIINNSIALEQFENSDTWFIMMEMYNNFLKPTCYTSVILVSSYIVVTIIFDIIKFIKNKKS